MFVDDIRQDNRLTKTTIYSILLNVAEGEDVFANIEALHSRECNTLNYKELVGRRYFWRSLMRGACEAQYSPSRSFFRRGNTIYSGLHSRDSDA